MIRNIIARLGLAFGLMSSAAACSGTFAAEEEQSSSGTLSVPLLASAGSHLYRLEGEMWLSGPVFTYLSLDGDSEVVSASLPTGSYSTHLYAWSLTRDDGAGNFVPVDAELLSSSSSMVSIYNQTTSTLSFEFQTDGQIVTVGSGSLRVVVEVTETPGVCTPLGDDCPIGTWCAPPELTGASLSCVAAGPLAAGEPCGSPSDCAANTSCFDFGSGPLCTALCSSTDLGLPCAEGGTCTAQGVDYGVCAPSSP